jgi:hypothetical protein
MMQTPDDVGASRHSRLKRHGGAFLDAWSAAWKRAIRGLVDLGPPADDAPGGDSMQARLLAFGSIEVDGRTYEHDIVIDGGRVRKRKKKPSKAHRHQFGHTPLSADEELPWGGRRLIIGTGAYGSLPIMPEVSEEAARRGVGLAAVPTEDACRLIAGLEKPEVHAVLHVTC